MQTRSGPFDDLGNLMTNAFGAVKGVGDEVRAMGRAQAERVISDMDLITRDDFEILKEMFAAQQSEIMALKKEVAALKKKAKAK